MKLNLAFRSLLLTAVFLSLPSLAQPLKVVTSINPLALMVRSIAGELTSVEVLLEPGQSPHDFTLTMSDRHRLDSADLIIWVGPLFEPYMSDLVGEHGLAMEAVAAREHSGVETEHRKHGHEHHHDKRGHLWLEPDAGVQMLRAVGVRLSELDPANAAHYKARANELAEEIELLIALSGAHRSGREYLVAHDAYGGFVKEFQYPEPIVASESPELSPGVRSLWLLGKQLNQGECLLVDVNHKRKWIQAFAEKQQLKLVEVDIMGLDIDVLTYKQLLQSLQGKFEACIERE